MKNEIKVRDLIKWLTEFNMDAVIYIGDGESLKKMECNYYLFFDIDFMEAVTACIPSRNTLIAQIILQQIRTIRCTRCQLVTAFIFRMSGMPLNPGKAHLMRLHSL